MTITVQPSTHAAAPAVTAPTCRLDERRLAGFGALVFATLVVVANILQGSMPALNADSAEVVTYLTDHRAENIFATVGFALGSLFLLMFASAFYGRLKATGRPEDLVWARFGMIGAVLILPTFAAVVVQRLVLLVGMDELIATPELITLVWRLEMAAFLVNVLPVSAAVVGFGIAGARSGLLPAWFRHWSPIAAGAGIVTAACAVAGLEGSPIGFGGILPFATWMLTLFVAGIRQLRSA
jgi:hypothetical protein